MVKAIQVKKSLGQHFLQDPTVAHNIVALLTPAGRAGTVVEVGPGMGSLTDVLLQQPIADLQLVEIDQELIPYLKKRYRLLEDKIIAADFLTLPLAEQFQGRLLTIVGNFPYNISTPILFKILANRHIVKEVVGMVQKEVAQRLTAGPNNKHYGIPSLLLQAFYTITYCFTVPPHAFWPRPKVDSAVITMCRNDVKQLPCNELLFFKLVKSGFQQRRKKLRNALHTFPIAHIKEKEILHKRAEALSVADFIQLTNALNIKEGEGKYI